MNGNEARGSVAVAGLDGDGMRRLVVMAVAAAALTLALAARIGSVAADQFSAPWDLVFETPNLGTIKLIQGGKNPYDPEIYAAPPFIITLYTPLYHYLVAALPEHSGNPFFTGRLVSMLSLLAAAHLVE